MRVVKRCGADGCGEFIERHESYCKEHKGYANKQYNDWRNEEQAEYVAFYKSSKWRKLRKSVMREQQYLCQDCKDNGIIKIGEELHHVISTRTEEGWEKRLDREGLRFLCRDCHSVHSAREKKQRG